ncbi:DNA-directed RNA polymerase II subunit RPB7 [Porphyridium purpureum]|uniref:DNA-directed RNA polymerase II subunit RPB7 n=1 Tax=Porphyridium purpureum TaxID=35688 RepID=A0A5J4YKQ4_PORPP|nr:DNA-directed RNA polymerase II subunit RPB7 [Porphyridium purpureum]|eukprot:POR3309..scf210_14
MYFLLDLSHNVRVPPVYFSENIRATIKQRLFTDVEGRFLGAYGFVVAITEVKCLGLRLLGNDGALGSGAARGSELPPGEIDSASGMAVFPVRFQALVFRPFKGECVDAHVTRVTQHGFFAESGPLIIFVSHHLLPEDMQYKTEGGEVRFQSRGNAYDVIKALSCVRLKIIGLKIEATEITATGSMREDFLGLQS